MQRSSTMPIVNHSTENTVSWKRRPGLRINASGFAALIKIGPCRINRGAIKQCGGDVVRIGDMVNRTALKVLCGDDAPMTSMSTVGKLQIAGALEQVLTLPKSLAVGMPARESLKLVSGK
jgi:hypothetical protein